MLACGAQHSYFGKSEWEDFAPGLKTLEQATELRRRILSAFEQAENELDTERQRALLTFVVVGAVPTGVEMAGAIADISRTVLVRDFRRINPSSARVVLVEAGPRILPTFSEKLGERAHKDLGALGVEVRTGARVTAVDAEGVTLGEERLPSRTVVWAAGVEAARLTRSLGYLFSTRGARLITEREWRLDPRAAASRTPLGAPTAGPKTPAEGTTTGTRGTEADRLGPSWT